MSVVTQTMVLICRTDDDELKEEKDHDEYVIDSVTDVVTAVQDDDSIDRMNVMSLSVQLAAVIGEQFEQAFRRVSNEPRSTRLNALMAVFCRCLSLLCGSASPADPPSIAAWPSAALLKSHKSWVCSSRQLRFELLVPAGAVM